MGNPSSSNNRVFAPILPDWELTLLRSVATGVETENLAASYRQVGRKWRDHSKLYRFAAVCLVVADLCDQGWKIIPVANRFLLRPGHPELGPDRDIDRAKDHVRAGLRVGRDRQLREPSVGRFIDSMERGSSFRKPISSVISSGEDLLEQLQAVAGKSGSPEAFASSARSVIDPYVDFCDGDAACERTGIRKIDIWRYFRHTWSMEYRSVPGRSFAMLIRNRALPNHPVIGISMLASPVMKMRERDAWLGLSMESFERAVAENPPSASAALKGLKATLDDAIAAIRHDDLISRSEIDGPSSDTIMKLQRRAEGARLIHESKLKASDIIHRGIDGEDLGAIDWLAASEDPLFVHKRAKVLASLLSSKRVLNGFSTGDDLLIGLLKAEGRRAVEIVLKERLKTVISTQVMDLSVCGGIAPYSALTSGKLTALLMTSSEVQNAIEDRYNGTPSVIASQMAGRPVSKNARLLAITTTSLYGVGSSQYNRLRLSADQFVGLKSSIRFDEVAKTDGFGSIHLSNQTVEALRDVALDEHGVRRINSRFGEGTSPRIRQIREGLEALGINPSAVLEHSTKRILYGCHLPQSPERVNHQSEIAQAWLHRWAIKRLSIDHVRDRIRSEGPSTIIDALSLNQNGQGELRFTG